MIGKKGEQSQTLLSEYVVEVDCFESVNTLAAVDVSYKGGAASSACVITDVGGTVLRQKVWKGRPTFPYVSSFFALREFPLIYKVLKDAEYDILFVHGHGKAHPRRFGLACHTGLYFNKPTIGVAGKNLVGEYEPHFEKWTSLYSQGDIVGAVLRTQATMNSIFVSVGHRISLQSAVKLTFNAVKTHKFPEVMRLAHLASRQGL